MTLALPPQTGFQWAGGPQGSELEAVEPYDILQSAIAMQHNKGQTMRCDDFSSWGFFGYRQKCSSQCRSDKHHRLAGLGLGEAATQKSTVRGESTHSGKADGSFPKPKRTLRYLSVGGANFMAMQCKLLTQFKQSFQ